MRRFAIVTLVVLVVDFVTKLIVRAELPGIGHSVSVLGDVVRLTHVRNTGSAFSLMQGGRIFFIGFSLVSIVMILLLVKQARYRTPGFGYALGMILGGAFGNLVDRVFRGAVTDWVDVGVPSYRWPTFNVADVGVSVGVCLLALLLLRGARAQPPVTTGS